MSDSSSELSVFAADPAGREHEVARLQALVVRLRTVEQQRDAWRSRCESLAEERDQQRESARRLRTSRSYRLGRTLVTLARDPLHSSPRLLRGLVRRMRSRVPAGPRLTRTAGPALPTHLYVAIGLGLPGLRSLVLALQRRLLVEPDHRAVVLTDDPAFSLLRKSGLIIEYLPDRETWHRHRPDRPWDTVLAERLARLSREHATAQVVFIDPEHPPTLADLLRHRDTAAPLRRALPHS
jgi:hypothetical protein